MKYFSLLFAILIGNSIHSQVQWVSKKVGDNITISFPKAPSSDTRPAQRLTLYVSTLQNSNCLFTVLERKSAVPNYSDISKLAPIERQKKLNDFLSRGITDLLKNDEILSSIIDVNIGANLSKKVAYKMIDKNGDASYQLARFLLIKGDLYLIQLAAKTQLECVTEGERFLDSVKIID